MHPRPRLLLMIIALVALSLGALTNAQTEPETTPEPQPQVEAQAEPVQPAPAPDANRLLIGARTDVELMAFEVLGNVRPEGWDGTLDINNPQLALLIRLDLESLAGRLLGETQRPTNWFGAVAGDLFSIARDIRHDVELLADEVFGAGNRPNDWVGTPNPLYLCNRATQTLVTLLARGGVFTISVDPGAPDYCRQVELEVVRFSENTLLRQASDRPIFDRGVQAVLPGSVTIDTRFAVAFLDRGASRSVGVIPEGTPVLPIARSYVRFSNMLLVSNDEFILFVDYRDTSLDSEQFEALPNIDDYEGTAPFCSARWCN